MKKMFLVFGLILGFFAAPAHAAKNSEGVLVTVVVLDEAGEPIKSAVIRHPEEADRHRVNSVDGKWEGNVLFMPDGTELRFTPGMMLDLEISAAGYMTQVFQYQVRKRRNIVEVRLVAIQMDAEQIDEPIITFKQDKPRETLVDVPR